MKLALGTVQFGMDYGVSNTSGQVARSEVEAILLQARSYGIDTLDCAHGYGDSERVLGQLEVAGQFSVVTKTPHLAKPGALSLREAFELSLARLQRKSVYGLLVHNAEDLLGPRGPDYFEEMTSLKSENVVTKIGVSVYSPAQLDSVLDSYAVDLVQLPLNVFAQDFYRTGTIDKLKRRGVEVHVRSPFLQGLALMSPAELPAFFSPVKSKVEALHHVAAKEQLTPLHLALGFLKSIPGIDRLVFGAINARQLDEICAALLASIPKLDFSHFEFSDVKFSNPSNWRL
jgi:aryl-alcohol dehydrogenase-like predicted oxidoreductase